MQQRQFVTLSQLVIVKLFVISLVMIKFSQSIRLLIFYEIIRAFESEKNTITQTEWEKTRSVRKLFFSIFLTASPLFKSIFKTIRHSGKVYQTN